MSGVDNPNLPLKIDTSLYRTGEVPGADWTDGLNKGSCMPGVGINTGDYDPKASDWPAVATDPAESQYIGQSAESLTAVDYAAADENDTLAFVTADADTAPDAVFNAASGAVNRTGQTIPSGDYAWGTVPVA